MSTEFFNDQWRIPSNENQNKVSNYSMDFDGTSDFITISNPTELTDDFTIAAWIYPTRVDDSYEMIYTQGTTVGAPNVPPYFAVQDTKLHVYITGVYQTGLNFITADEWQHVAVTRTSGVLNLYRNGIEYNGSRPTQNGTINTGLPGIIGKWYDSSHTFKGKIDQTCIFDYALPASGTNSIATLYGGGTAVTNPMALSPKPIAYYQLGDQSVDNGANYLVPNNSLQDYVFNIQPSQKINTTLTPPTEANNRTFSVWFKTGVNAFENICGYGTAATSQGFDICTHPSPSAYSIGVHAYGPAIIANGVYTPNQWNHYAVTYDGTILRGYLNGEPVNTSTIALNTGTSVDFTIGGGAYTPANGFSGDVSNIAIWDSVLTASNVSTIYNNGVPNDISSLSPVSWWKLNAQDTLNYSFNTPGNWTIKDYAGSNDGTSNGMTSANLVQSNLQHTSGFSPYALDFDGTNQEFDIPSVSTLELYNTDFSISFWCKVDASATNPMFFEKYAGGGGWSLYVNTDRLRFYNGSGWTYISGAFQTVYAGLWTNVTVVGDLASTNLKCYINGNEVHSSTNTLIQIQNTSILTMAGSSGLSFSYAGGLSNVAIWSGTALSAAQVTEIYNSGVPISLNTFSGNKPNHWWQLGSNSSFNSNSWTCLDEGISSSISPLTSAVSTANMANDDIINGVGYTGNGLGASTIDILGDAPYSTANGLSENIDVLDRTTDVPPTV